MSHDENSQVSAAEQPTGDQFEVLARQVAKWTQERDRLQDLIDTAMPDAAHLASQSQAAQPSIKTWRERALELGEKALDPKTAYGLLQAEIDELRAHLAGQSQATRAVPEGVQKALQTIARWELPASGRAWDAGTPMSYGAAFGSNGERDYMRQVALDALSLLAPTAQEVTLQAAKAETAEQAEGKQANVLPPTRGTDSQRNADPYDVIEFAFELAENEGNQRGMDFLSAWWWETNDDFLRTNWPEFAKLELASRFRAQGGNTNDKGSDLAPTTSTVSAEKGASHE